MAEEMQVSSNPVNPTSLTIKRKRGRPRKDDCPPGSESGCRRRRKSYSCDVSVGQVVSGVLDGKFDAGYMLTVRVGDTGTLLRGVVFEPGQSITISAANDIAPHVSMLARTQLPIPSVEFRNHSLMKEKDPVTASVGIPISSVDVARKLDSHSLAGAIKVETKMYSVVNQSPMVQQSVNQKIASNEDVSNVGPSNTLKVSPLDSESRTLPTNETFHPKTLSVAIGKGQLPTPEVVTSNSEPGSTSLPPAANFNSQSNGNNIVEEKIGLTNQTASPVAVPAADARKEEATDLDNQPPEKKTALFSDTLSKVLVETDSSVKIENKTEENIVSSTAAEPKVNDTDREPDSKF